MEDTRQHIPTTPRETHGGIRYLGHKTRLELSKKNNQLERANRTDFKTGVGNDCALEEWLKADEKSKANETKSDGRGVNNLYPLSGVAIFLDADGLDKANSQGHPHGDLFIQNIAAAGKKITSRPNDRIFRRGDRSDEFVLVFPGLQRDGCKNLAKLFEKYLEEISGENNFTASLAVGYFSENVTVRKIVNELDSELSKAKNKRPKGEHIETIILEDK